MSLFAIYIHLRTCLLLTLLFTEVSYEVFHWKSWISIKTMSREQICTGYVYSDVVQYCGNLSVYYCHKLSFIWDFFVLWLSSLCRWDIKAVTKAVSLLEIWMRMQHWEICIHCVCLRGKLCVLLVWKHQ